jgi:hypothetical protein
MAAEKVEAVAGCEAEAARYVLRFGYGDEGVVVAVELSYAGATCGWRVEGCA